MNKLKRLALNIIAEQLSETEIGSLKVGPWVRRPSVGCLVWFGLWGFRVSER